MNRIMKQILQEVLEEIRPAAKKIKEADEFIRRLNSEIKKYRIKATAVPGGSYAKDTWLSGDHDIDIFVKFDMKYASEDLSRMLEKILSKFKPERLHGSRDYYWVKEHFRYEIVPVLNIRKAADAQNVTDFSPSHVQWVNTKGKKYKNDIRLAKRFCKAAGCYGAESYIHGFSGHVIDVLVIHHKGFVQLLKAALKWKPKVIIDYNGKIGKKATFILNKSKIQGPMIVIDPVQPDRNAAAALNKQMFELFVEKAKNFLKKPGKEFFEYRGIDYPLLKKQGKVYAIKANVPQGKEDPVGAKLLKAHEFISEKLKGFEVKDKGWQWNKGKNAEFWYVLGKERLPEAFETPGPPMNIKEHTSKFRKKHKKIFVRKGRLYAITKYKYRDVNEYLEKEVLKSDYLKNKVTKCQLRKI